LIARVDRRKGDYVEALKVLREQLQVAQAGQDQPQIALTHSDIGAVLIEQEQYTEALKEYDESLAINRGLGTQLNIAYNQHNRGNILARLGLRDEALAALQEAADLIARPEVNYKALQPEIELSHAAMALSELRFADADARGRQVLKMLNGQSPNVAAEATYTAGLAKVFSRQSREGLILCQKAVEMATKVGDDAMLSRAMLALAQAQMASGDLTGALATVTEAEQRLDRAGQWESGWRASLVAGRIYQSMKNETGAQEELGKAATKLKKLEEKWGSSYYASYISRPDIQVLRKQLGLT
jgi:tetratricopeptide (TPR) repeat protein